MQCVAVKGLFVICTYFWNGPHLKECENRISFTPVLGCINSVANYIAWPLDVKMNNMATKPSI